MVSRSTRLSDTLETLHDRPFDSNSISDTRTLHKSELRAITARFNITVEHPSPTIPDYRQAIRTHIDRLSNTKSPQTTFNTREIHTIGRTLRTSDWLDSSTVVPFLETCRDNTTETLIVNNTPYTVTEYVEQHNMPAGGYDGYIAAIFETDTRLISFYNWDSNNCYYKTSAALEIQTGHIPYLTWEHDSYITNIQTPDTHSP